MIAFTIGLVIGYVFRWKQNPILESLPVIVEQTKAKIKAWRSK